MYTEIDFVPKRRYTTNVRRLYNLEQIFSNCNTRKWGYLCSTHVGGAGVCPTRTTSRVGVMITIDFAKVVFWPTLIVAVMLGYVPSWFLVALALYSIKLEGTFSLR